MQILKELLLPNYLDKKLTPTERKQYDKLITKLKKETMSFMEIEKLYADRVQKTDNNDIKARKIADKGFKVISEQKKTMQDIQFLLKTFKNKYN